MLKNLEETFTQRWDQELSSIVRKTGIDLTKITSSVELASHAEMFAPKEPGFFLLRKGFVKVCRVEDDQVHAIRIANPGSLLGYGNWYLENPEIFQVTALTKCTLTLYRKAPFERLLETSKGLNSLITESLCRTILIKDQRIVALERTSSRDRIISLLISLAQKLGKKTDEGILISVDIGRSTMAQLSGTTQVNISRVLTDLEQLGLIRRIRRTLLITDLGDLRIMLKASTPGALKETS